MAHQDAKETERPRGNVWLRLAMAVGGFAVLTVPAGVIAAHLPGGRDGSQGLALRTIAGAAVIALLVVVLSRLLKGETARTLGLSSPRRGWISLTGVALASAAAVTLIGCVALATGSAALDSTALTDALLTTAVIVPVLMVAWVVPEELVFRGYIQHVLGHHFAPMSAIAIQALLFSAATSVVSLLVDGPATALINGVTFMAFITGVGLGYVRLFSRGLWGVLGLRLTLTALVVFTWEAGLEFALAEMFWSLAMSIVAVVVALVVGSMLKPPQVQTSPHGDQGSRPRRELTQKGILYDVGTSYMPGQHSRHRWNAQVVQEELRVIHQELHCTAAILFGESPQRLEEAGRMALEQGLYVWLQPRRFDMPLRDVLENLAEVAGIAERLGDEYPDQIGLSIGCEVSLLHRGILPGDLTWRMRWLAVVSALVPPYLGWQLNRVLYQMAALAREHFAGPLTYAAGTWESVRWGQFDAVGVNYYTDMMTQSDYRGGLRRLAAGGKPVLVTEFGCCSYEGSQDKGGSGSDIMDWSDLNDRRITGGHRRDEQVQADHLEAQLDVFETEDVHGAFLCMFIEGDCHYSPDPTRDLDMASFGIVRPPSLESGLSADEGHWEPKRAFHALARRYKASVPA